MSHAENIPQKNRKIHENANDFSCHFQYNLSNLARISFPFLENFPFGLL